jgi:hypothetical protein
MKSPFRHLLVVAAIIAVPTLLSAQPGQQRPQINPDEYAKNMVTQLSERMELRDGQKDSLTVVFKGFMESQREAMANRDRDKMMSLREKRDKDAEAIIKDDEKIKAYKKFLQEQAPMGRGQRGNG